MTAQDIDSLDELFARHYLGLVRLAAHLVDDLETAEDVVQDVFAALDPSRLPTDPERYLRTAVVNRSRSALRRRRVARTFAGRAHRLEVVEPADTASLRNADRDRALAAIASLPTRQREAVVLRYYEDLSVADIASVLGASPGSISSALHRALATLATTLEEHDA